MRDKSILIAFAVILLFKILGATCEGADHCAFTEQWEGRLHSVYTDTTGHASVGVGFNLTRSDARERLLALGVCLDTLKAGKTSLTDAQVEILYRHDMARAVKDARRIFPSYDSQPEMVQLILADLSFNLGPNRLQKFVQFRKAIEDRHYVDAADELFQSKWFKQTGRRADHHVDALIDAEFNADIERVFGKKRS